jgi:hypothetical protein
VIHQALCSPRVEIVHQRVERVGDDRWRVEVGVANVGWLATDVSAYARKHDLVPPTWAELDGDVTVVGGPARQRVGVLDGRAALRFRHGNDGTPDRALVSWLVTAPAGATATVTVSSARAGRAERTIDLV